MDRTTAATLCIGDWQVWPARGEITRGEETVRLDERAMRLLLCLAERAGEIVSIDELLNLVWAGVAVSPDSVYQAVASLRRVLGDDSKDPAYIANVPRLGYRMVARVTQVDDPRSSPVSGAPAPRAFLRRRLFWISGTVVALCAVAGAYVLLRGPAAHANRPAPASTPAASSVAVLPILDLTPGMQNGEFADGITEELIDKLSKVPGFQVPPPTSSFALKGKQPSASEAARALGVAYVLDGSVRTSNGWVRVDVRLIRASSGFIVWSETYDQPTSDILSIQNDIAVKVTAALKASIGPGTNSSSAK